MLEIFTGHPWLLWLIVSFVCLIIELGSGDLYMLSLAVGALVAMIVMPFSPPLWLQIVVFAVTAVLSIAFVRPPLLRRLHAGGSTRKSNADALLGRHGTVIETIPATGHGYVRIDGDEWRSLSATGEDIPLGTKVEVVGRESIVITVRPV